MRKYTAKEVVDETITFCPMTKEEYYKVADRMKEAFPEFSNKIKPWGEDRYYRFSRVGISKRLDTGRSDHSYVDDTQQSLLQYGSKKQITFEEFSFEDEPEFDNNEMNEMAKSLGINFNFE